jgi:hypothetical protein
MTLTASDGWCLIIVLVLSRSLNNFAHPNVRLWFSITYAFEELDRSGVGPRRVDKRHPDTVPVHASFHLVIELRA